MFYLSNGDGKNILGLGINKNEYGEVSVDTDLNIRNYSNFLMRMSDIHGEFIDDFDGLMGMRGMYYDEGINALEDITIAMREHMMRFSERYGLEYGEI